MPFVCVLTIGIAALTLAHCNVHAAGKLSRTLIVTTQEWKPYNFRLDDGTVGGDATAVIRNVLKEMGVDCHITIYPWARAQQMVKDGHADAFYAASRNSERDAYAVLSDPIAPQTWFWYTRKTSKVSPSDPGFAEKAQVGALLGSNMLHYLERNRFRIKGTPYDMDSLVRMLDQNMLDAVLVSGESMQAYLSERHGGKDQYRKAAVLENPLGIYFSKKFLAENPWFLGEFNRVLRKYSLKKTR